MSASAVRGPATQGRDQPVPVSWFCAGDGGCQLHSARSHCVQTSDAYRAARNAAPLNTPSGSLLKTALNLSVQFMLLPPPDRARGPLASMQRFDAGCDALAAVATAHRRLHKAEFPKRADHDIREESGLSAQTRRDSVDPLKADGALQRLR
jgi:hypothetical protein